MKNKLILFIILVFAVNIVFAQNKLTKEQLVADVDTLYAQMYDIHPDLFATLSQSKFEKELGRIKSEFKDGMTAVDFYRKITPLVVRLGDGHTNVYTPSYSVNWETEKIAFPIAVDIDKKDYTITVKDNFNDSEVNIPAGTKILSINGRKTKKIVQDFLKYASGENNNFRIERIKNDFYLLPFFVYGDQSGFTVTYEQEKKKEKATVAALTLRQYFDKEEKKRREKQEVRRNYSLSINKDINTAIIDFRSLMDLDNFKLFIDSAFTVIKDQNIGNLIIDVRKNGGGNSALGNEFFQYISPVPFQQFGKAYRKLSPTLKRIDNDNIYHKSTDELGIRLSEYPLIELRENDKRFTGNCYLLTSNYTFSSAGSFSWAFHHFKMGKIIGEETGGLIVCFGDIISSKVPNTGVEFGASFRKFYGYGANDSQRHGVRPDCKIPADEAMDYAVNMIRKDK